MDESQEEDCTIYIEELKSDDPNLKINAVSKISSIAQILGSYRTAHELVPYLIEIVEEQDNEDEFLVKLAEEILSLKNHIGGEAKTHLLIAPLEILSSMEEPVVREKAVQVLIELAENQNHQFYEVHLLQVVQQLGQWDNFPSRISACSLLPTLYGKVDLEKQEMLSELFKQLCTDDTPMVRRTAAGSIGQLASLYLKNQKDQQLTLLESWQKLLKDTIDSVKIRAVESAPQMLKLMQSNGCSLDEFMTTFFSLADPTEKSWRVRYSVPETLPSIIIYLTKDIIKNKALPTFELLLKDPEQEVRSVTLQSSYSLLSSLPSSSTTQFITSFSALAQDPSPHVRLSLAEQLCKLASVYSVDTVIQQLMPIVNQLFRDEVIDIKSKLTHNLPQLSQVLGPDNSKKHIVPLIQQFGNEKQWRFRLEVVSIIPKLLKVSGFDSFQELQQILLEKAVLNHYQAIRDQAIDNFIQLKEIFGYDKIKPFLKQSIQKLFTETNYIFRVTAFHALIKLKNTLSKDDLLSLFKEISAKGMNDKVPNVRLNVYKCFIGLKDKLDDRTIKEFMTSAKKFENDPDSDVQYYVLNLNQ